MVNIDQRANFQGERGTPSGPVSGSVSRIRHVQKGRLTCSAFMHDPPARRLAPSSARAVSTARPARSCAALRPVGYEFRTFACSRCDRAQRTLVVSDPMSGDATGWLRGELKSPD